MDELIPASEVVQYRSKADWCDLFGGELILENAAEEIRRSLDAQRSAEQSNVITLSHDLSHTKTITANDIRSMNTTQFTVLLLDLNIPPLSFLTHVSDEYWMQWRDECLSRGTYSATVIPHACPGDEKTLLAHAFFCQNVLSVLCRPDDDYPPKGVDELRLKHRTSSAHLIDHSGEE